MLQLDRWVTPASNYPICKLGRARVVKFRYTRGYYNCYHVRGVDYVQVTKAVQVTGLKIRGKVWMVDDFPHWWAMEDHAQAYHGHVVVAGLGLGLILHALAANPAVTKVTCVEIEPDVVDLIRPLVPPVEIVTGDFWEWEGQPDGILFDLFVGDGRALLGEAVWTYLRLRTQFPGATVRIHGFRNDVLEELWTGAPSSAR